MRKRKIDPDIIKWYESYLRNRVASATVKGITNLRQLEMGCPQGGVLSVLIWSLIFDDLLEKFGKGKVRCIGYADDACLVIQGSNLKEMHRLMNLAINITVGWANESGLEISAEKTVAVLFTTKTEIGENTEEKLYINGNVVPLSNEAKYLGLTLDSKLSWNIHVDNKIKSAKRAMHMIRNTTGKLWGPKPEIMVWGYEAMVRPILLYWIFVYGHSVTKTQMNKMKSLQRQALMQLGNFRKGTPGDGLDIIFNVTPIDLFIEEEILKARTRLSGKLDYNWKGKAFGKKHGHIKMADELSAKTNFGPVQLDKIEKEIIWNRNFTVDKSSFSTGRDVLTGLRCYTDGSKMFGNTGLGLCIINNEDPPIKVKKGMAGYNTVFQAEVNAITVACKAIKKYLARSNEKHTKVTILCDAQSALQAIDSLHTKTQSVKAAISALDELGNVIEIELAWIKAHVNYFGNEVADEMAKEGTTEPDTIGANIPVNMLKKGIHDYIRDKWIDRWHKSDSCRQTQIFFKTPNKNLTKTILQLNRADLSTLVQHTTGHSFLSRHNYLTGDSDTSLCRFCKTAQETSSHLICSCEALWKLRGETMNYYFVNEKRPEWNVGYLLAFLNHPRIKGEDSTVEE
jgi:ribonuclease HI